MFYLESGGDVDACQDLMGHSSPKTTQTYLRRLNREQRIENGCTLDWSAVPSEATDQFEESRVMGAGGFEPP